MPSAIVQVLNCDQVKRLIHQTSVGFRRGRLSVDSLLSATRLPTTDCRPIDRAWVAQTRVYALRQASRNEEAARLALDALTTYAAMLRPGDIAKLSSYLGNALYYMERYDEAMPHLERARRHYLEKQNYDGAQAAELTTNIAWGRLALGDTLEAVCLLAHAERTIRRAGDSPHMRSVLQSLRRAQARAAPYGNIATDSVCRAGDVRRKPLNDDGMSRLNVWTLVAIGVVLLTLIVHAAYTATRRRREPPEKKRYFNFFGNGVDY